MIYFDNTANDSVPVELALQVDDRTGERANLTHNGRMIGWIEHKSNFFHSTPCESPYVIVSILTNK